MLSSVADLTSVAGRAGIFEMGGMERDDEGHAFHSSIFNAEA
jgi:hypothetical protein